MKFSRRILGSNIIVLIFSSNKDHLKWIQKFPNVLYTNTATIYNSYIKNYNEKGLKELKREVEEKYKIKLLDFTNDFLLYPLYKNNEKYSNINCSEKSPYIREVLNYNASFNSLLIMNDSVIFEIARGKKENPNWDVTLEDNEITLFSNGYYLGYDDKTKKIVSDKYMRRWNYINIMNGGFIIKTSSNLFLSIENNSLILKYNIDNNCNHSIFQLIDIN